MTHVLISRAHDWRQKSARNPVLHCMDCGFEKPIGLKTYVPCKRKGESPTSGYSGILVDENLQYIARFRMAGKHLITGRPFAQWSNQQISEEPAA